MRSISTKERRPTARGTICLSRTTCLPTAGYLNGEATTVTFNNESQFRTVQNSSDYAGHLFALQLSNGVVSSVMDGYNQKATTNADAGPMLLHDYATPSNTTNGVELVFHTGAYTNANHIRTSFTNATYDSFEVGAANGNPYTLTTRAIYYRDTAGTDNSAANANGETNLSYNPSNRTIKVSDDRGAGSDVTYWLAAGATVVGEPTWLNTRECDVTIVFDNDKANALVATEVYITPDPDWTPTPGPVGDTDNMQILQASYDNANQKLTFIVSIDNNVTFTTGDTVTLTLKDNTTNITVVNGVVKSYSATPGDAGHISTGISSGSKYQYTVVFAASGLSMMDNTNRYSGRLTLLDANGTAVTAATGDTYVDNFTSLSIF